MSNDALEQFRQRWGIVLTLPPALHSHVEGRVLPWQEDWIDRLEQALSRLPRALVNAAQVRYLFVAEDLRRGGLPHEGVTYEFTGQPEPKWIGLNVSLFTDQRGETEQYLQVLVLDARLLEEIAHVWDFRLEEAGAPYSSVGEEWLKVEFDERGRRKPFDLPNRRFYASIEEQNAEDWAAAVVWYVFQRDRLRQRASEHYEFVERLFGRCLPS